jgi:hypothetical protein
MPSGGLQLEPSRTDPTHHTITMPEVRGRERGVLCELPGWRRRFPVDHDYDLLRLDRRLVV